MPGSLSSKGIEIDYNVFRSAVREVDFLRVLVEQAGRELDPKSQDHAPVAEYDYEQPTDKNYATGQGSPEHFGEFAAIRSGLDYSYHAHYTEARQKWQVVSSK